jgi:hypothetical protein
MELKRGGSAYNFAGRPSMAGQKNGKHVLFST